jgi:YHS domain-containing protein
MNIKIPLLLLVILSSCNNNTETKTDSPSVMPPAAKDSVVVARINIAETDLADKKDVVCGMPAFQYLSDTAVYNGKIYGFCSKDCKNDFLKDPASYLAKK